MFYCPIKLQTSFRYCLVSIQLSAISYQLLNKTGQQKFNLSYVTALKPVPQTRSLCHKAVRVA
ncbi:hypothetical protein [Moorena sp. SIO2C4]|uniref:hypothetical protein n=1 Tax=Moorena sp. SIO2C4 TaxID=2607824 RepID=UPI00031BA3D3|nr:hypothetical protein [Moorena sp. SIO2C4]NES41410.1 hypothetical protein [Moorena sp. SIO2C4]